MNWWQRLIRALGDMLVLTCCIGIATTIVFGCVHLFRLFDTGHLLLLAISKCSPFLIELVWPVSILSLVILFREHVVRALEKVPIFIENYALKDKITPSDSRNDQCAEAKGCVPGKNSDESASRKLPDQTEDNGGNTTSPISTETIPHPARKSDICIASSSLSTKDDAKLFVDYVLTLLQNETKTIICRNVNLFKKKGVTFDGAMVRKNIITGIEVHYGIGNYERKLMMYERFYKSLSERERESFELLFCVRGCDALLDELQSYRERISVPVEFRTFEFRPNCAETFRQKVEEEK